jgi:serine/threonine protein kinase
MTIARGSTLGPYEILSLIGAGGMGQVYRAKDLKLGRDVAVKVLREELAAHPERLRRFEQEARSASALNHPNIIHIYDIGKHGETPYIAMEFVEGKTLREVLSEEPLPTKKLLQLATQIAEGLAKAHSAGIVHRDLKPENLMVSSDGYVKILDFGLAKLLPQPGIDSEAATITKEGTVAGAVMGTAGYMSPEQVRGEPADHRTDIFSIGCVLYELVCGRRAFSKDTAAEAMTAILKEEPSDLRSLAGDLPPSLTNIVRRCLEKRPEARFQTGQDLAFALRSALLDDSGPIVHATSEEKSIVVLPFENLSPAPDQEYFVDGLTEEIISDLAKVGALRVISRTSAMQLKGTDKDLRTIGRELSVRYVLEGSVRRAGNALRITAQLIDAATDTHLWAEKYRGTLDDVFDIQEKVSRSIVGELELRLTPDEEKKIAERPIEDTQAYECYMRARQEIYRFSDVGFNRALQLIEQGLEIVGDNELLYATMGHAYVEQLLWGQKTDPGDLLEAERCTEKVFALNPDSAHGFNLRAMIHYKKGERIDAARMFKRVLAIDPNNSDALVWLTSLYTRAGQTTPPRPLIQKLLDIDPLSSINHTWMGWINYWETGSTSPPLDAFRRMYETDPHNPYGQWIYSYFLAQAGRSHEAFRLLDLLIDRVPNMAFGRLARFLKAALKGNRDEAIASVSQELESWARWDDVGSSYMADCYALAGDTAQALDWMENAIRLGFINYRHYSLDRFLDGIRDDKRFQQIMERVKYEWEHFEV